MRGHGVWVSAALGALVLMVGQAERAPAEECRRDCPASAPRDARGCCAPAAPAKGSPAKATPGAGKATPGAGKATPGAGKAPSAKASAKAPGIWVRVKAGTFVMGSPPAEVARDDDEHQHEVTLTHDFLLLDTEVEQGDFQKLMGYNPSEAVSCGADCPVENVSWHEAAAYCNALSRLEGRPECYACTGSQSSVTCELSAAFVKPYQCSGYRLPTEAEWEYAARAGTTTATYGGDLDPAHLACEAPNPTLDPISWYCGNSGQHSHKVRTRAANAWGLYDVLGNVYEWCNDWYEEYRSGACTDPWGPPLETQRIVRGGSWCCRHNRDVRAAERMSEPPDQSHSAMGFRPARTLP